MVFPGKRSTGCITCRKRKVKCDGKKPHCERCMSRGTQCPGYPDNYAFREVRPSTHAGRQKLVVAPGSTTSSATATATATAAAVKPRHRNSKDYPTPESTPPSHVSCPITNPTISLEWQSVCYFIHHHVLRVHRSPCRGALAFFPDLYQEYASGSKGKTVGGSSCLKHAILSVSSLALYNASHVGELYVNARSHYGHAMKDLSYVLQEGRQEVISGDEVLGAVLFLLYFADLAGEMDTDRNELNPHIPGAHSVLNMRDTSHLTTKYGRELFGWAIVQIQVQSIFHRSFTYATLPLSIRMMYKPDNVYRAGIILDMIARVCLMISDTRAGLSPSESPSTDYKMPVYRMFMNAYFIIEEIDTWEETVPGHWRRQYDPDNAFDPDIKTEPDPREPNERDEWTTPYLAAIYSAQIKLYTVLHDLWGLFDAPHYLIYPQETDDYDQYQRRYEPLHFVPPVLRPPGLELRIRRLLHIICSTVTACLGTVDEDGEFHAVRNVKVASGWVLRVPMRTVLECPFASEEQIKACQGGLDFVSRSMGDMHMH